jgi:hypothetical protein
MWSHAIISPQGGPWALVMSRRLAESAADPLTLLRS